MFSGVVIGAAALMQVLSIVDGCPGHRVPACPSPFMTEVVPPPPTHTPTVKCGGGIAVFSAPNRLNMTHLIDPEGGFTLLLLSPGSLAVHVRPKQLHTASDGRNMF